MAYHDPYFSIVSHGRHYDLNMTETPLGNLEVHDAILIVTDNSSYDYRALLERAQLVIDTRNGTEGINSPKILRR